MLHDAEVLAPGVGVLAGHTPPALPQVDSAMAHDRPPFAAHFEGESVLVSAVAAPPANEPIAVNVARAGVRELLPDESETRRLEKAPGAVDDLLRGQVARLAADAGTRAVRRRQPKPIGDCRRFGGRRRRCLSLRAERTDDAAPLEYPGRLHMVRPVEAALDAVAGQAGFVSAVIGDRYVVEAHALRRMRRASVEILDVGEGRVERIACKRVGQGGVALQGVSAPRARAWSPDHETEPCGRYVGPDIGQITKSAPEPTGESIPFFCHTLCA